MTKRTTVTYASRCLALIVASFLAVPGVEAARLDEENVANIMPNELPSFAQTRGAVAIVIDAEEAKRVLDIKHKGDEYVAALSASLLKSGAFSQVADRGDADYLLEVIVTSVAMAGVAKIQIDLNTTWRLTDLATRRAVWGDVVGSSAVTTAKEAFKGAKRAQLTQEGAFRENIRLGLAQLAKAEIDN